MTLALVRDVPDSIARAELTHLERTPIVVERARAQHARYRELLAELGCSVAELPAEPELADSVFVEDTAVVLPEIAVITRPGAESRRPEVDSVADALADHRTLARIEAPGLVDGGDVLCVGRRIFIGRTGRTDDEGLRQVRALVEPHGYTVRAVDVTGCLHLKSAATQVAEGTVLLNPEWVAPEVFDGLACVEVDPSEPGAANALRVAGRVVLPAAFPRTRARLEQAGLEVLVVDADELAKAEGGLTCCSLLVEDSGAPPDRGAR